MSSAQAPPLHCPTCLQLCPAPVWLPCGHAFCPQCLQSMHQGLDRHCCPQCRAEYHPHYCYCYWYCNNLCNDHCNDPNPNSHHHMGPGRSNFQTSPAVKGTDAGGVDGGQSHGYIKKSRVEENSPVRNPIASPGIVKMSLCGELDKNVKQNMSIAELNEDVYGNIGYRFQNKTPNKEGCSMKNVESPGVDSIDQTLSAFKLGYPQEGECGGFQNESPRKDNSSFGNVVNPLSPTLNISQYKSATNGIESQIFQNQSPVVENCSINDLEIQEGSPSVVQMCGTAELEKSIGLKENPGSQNVVIKHNPDQMKTDTFQNKSLDVVKITGRLDKIEQIDQNMFAVRVKSDQEVQDIMVRSFQNKMTHLTTLQMQQQSIDVQETYRFQNKSPLATGEINQTPLKSEKIQMWNNSCRFQNKTCDSSEIGSSKINPPNAIAANCGGMGSFQEDFQCKSHVESDLFHYLKSKVEPKYGINEVSQDKTPLLKDSTQQSGEFQNKTPLLSPNEGLSASTGNPQQDILAIMAERSGENVAFQSKRPISMEDARKMDEYKSKLALKVPEFTDRLAKAELVLDREQRYVGNVTAANAKLRQNALKLVGDVTLFAQNYSDTVLALIEQQLGPGEKVISRRLEQASEMSERLRKTVRGAEDVLKEENSAFFMSRARSLEAEMEKCDAANRPEKPEIVEFNLTKLCPELERLGKEFRGRFTEVQRALRNAFNPSEVTFDPETLHPNLLLSDDLKTVTFSAKKQEYATTGKRFSSFLQVLSTQSFSSGQHRWELQLDGAPWIVGMCVASALPRSGLPSALETWPQSWCLMWNQNQLTAFDRSKATTLQKSPGAARRLELILDREAKCISLHQLTQTTGRCRLHSFNICTEEPLHLAYRMLSGDKGSVTICS